jgi:DNA-binding transcriptional LysR family regulator
MRGSEFADLRAFVAVAQQTSFARAADDLGVSASSLSTTIRQLEERLGVRLINRTTRRMSLTEAGERLFARFRPALAEMEAAVADARGLRDSPIGTVRLQIPRAASKLLIEPVLGRFFEAYPDVTLDITLDDSVTNTIEAGFDAGVRIGEFVEEDMVAVELCTDMRQLAVASPRYVARYGRPRTPADLLQHRCINWRWPGCSGLYNWEFAENGRWFSVAVNGPLIVSHRDVAIAAALQGVGIAFWAEPWMQAQILSGELVVLLEEFSPTFPGFYLCYSKQRNMAAPVRAFVNFIRQNFPLKWGHVPAEASSAVAPR